MAIRKSKQESYLVNGTLDAVLNKYTNALSIGKFTNIKINKFIHQLTGDYKKLTVWGEIIITLMVENNTIKINVVSTANTDNIFALFSSPNQKIINQFKNNLQ